MSDVPPGFEPIPRMSPFVAHIGPVHVGHDPPVFGLRIAPHHANRSGAVHGGLLVSFADLVLGRTLARALDVDLPGVTISLSVDFADAVTVGDWLEGRGEVLRAGRSTGFATAWLSVGDRRVARVSGVFARRPPG